MKKVLLFIGLLGSLNAFCQTSSENIAINVINPLTVTYNSIEELMQEKIISNALEVKMNPGQKFYLLSASAYFTAGNGVLLDNKLSLVLIHSTASAPGSYNRRIKLSTIETPLIEQAVLPGPGESLSYYYDLVIDPFTTFVKPGNYNFTLTFTATQQ